MNTIYLILIALVILGHLLFAYQQWFKWPELCEKLTDLKGTEIERTAFLGRSFASYNVSIGAGILLRFWLTPTSQIWVQGVTLCLIITTAAIGASGTKGNSILIARLIPAALALLCLMVLVTNSST